MAAAVSLAFVQQASGCGFMFFYSTDVFEKSVEFDEYLLTSMIGIANLTGSSFFYIKGALIALKLSNQLEKKSKILVGLSGQILSMWIINFSLYYNYDITAISATLVYMVFFGFGLGSSMYAYIPEILPPAGVGLAMASKWCFISLSGKLTPLMIDRIGVNWTLNIYTCILN